MIASRGTDQRLETRRHFVLFRLGLLESGKIVEVVNGGDVHDLLLHSLVPNINAIQR